MFRLLKSLFKGVFLSFVALFCIVGAYAGWQAASYHLEGGLQVVDDVTDPPLSEAYFHRGRPLTRATASLNPIVKWDYWRALRKFPTLRECLKPEGQDGSDLSYFAWQSLRTSEDAQICLHHALVHLGNSKEFAKWLEVKGFHVSWWGIKKNNFTAGWNVSQNGSVSPFNFYGHHKWVRWLSVFPVVGVSLNVRFDDPVRAQGHASELQIFISAK